MDHQPFAIGTFVTIKENFIADKLFFVWESISVGGENWVIVNTENDLIEKLKLKRVSDKNNYALFPNLEYALVKHYQINKGNVALLGGFEENFQNIIIQRKTFGRLGEFLFLLFQNQIQDKRLLSEELLPSLIDRIFTDRYSVFVDETNGNQKLKELKDKWKNLALMQLHILGVQLLFYRQLQNALSIMEKITMEDGRNFLQTIRQDKNLLEVFLQLVNEQSLFKTGMFSPLNTKETKPIVFSLTNSLYSFIGPEAEKYKSVLDETAIWEIEMNEKFPYLDHFSFSKFITGLYEKDLRELQKMMFSDIGSCLPISKPNGKKSIDYNLAFYIPIFKWLLPNPFADNPKLNSTKLRKQHIRNIKKFIAGKI